ncbi:MAG: hypothetical protein KatS3mg111_0591 [Pirellulaceae bacterium]|nr:MAG: hypothetical protein KatS3mg111_0591 [Pirellulaceae bacterium]
MRAGCLVLCAMTWGCWSASVHADLIFTAINTTETITFTGFDGSGFSPTPSSGQLDSNTWRVTGLSEGNGSFGGTHTTGDFARETSSGGVGTGGIYAFNTGSTSGVGLGVQPTGEDFTPGTITLRLKNDTGVVIEDLEIAYDVFIYNDQNRSNSFNFQYSADDTSYTPVSSLNLASPGGADSTSELGRHGAFYHTDWRQYRAGIAVLPPVDWR